MEREKSITQEETKDCTFHPTIKVTKKTHSRNRSPE